jgi:glycosyltransferase involved in cell wall biosynthesis
MKKKISVIVPCFNVTEFIDKCMESLLNQTIGLDNVEIILVDDASTDGGGTRERLLQYEKKFPENIMVILLEENMRQGGARNVGIQYATGEYLLFCDADDYLSLCAMERLYNAAKKYEADVVEFVMKKIWDYSEIDETLVSGKKSYFLDMSDEKVREEVIDLSLEEFGLGCMNKLYRTDMVQEYKIQFAEHLIYEEPSFTLPVRLCEQRHLYLDEVLYYYIQRQGSTMYGLDKQRYLDSIKVWNLLIEDLSERGFLDRYYDKLSKMYYDWGFLLNLYILLEKGETVTDDLFAKMTGMVVERFPQIERNTRFADERGQEGISVLHMKDVENRQEELFAIVKECVLGR